MTLVEFILTYLLIISFAVPVAMFALRWLMYFGFELAEYKPQSGRLPAYKNAAKWCAVKLGWIK